MKRSRWMWGVWLGLAACVPGKQEPQARAPVQVESVDVGGLVLYAGGMPGSRTRMGFGLFSPRTGRATPALREVVADGARVLAAGSPDGRTLAWLDGGGMLHVATLGLDAAGVPTVTETHALRMQGQERLAFTQSGDRVYSDKEFANPAPGGGVVPCAPGGHGPIVAADGRTWVGHCGGVQTVFHDSTPMLVLETAPSFDLSPDGQWGVNGAALHLPGLTIARRSGVPSTAASAEGLVTADNVVSPPSKGMDGKQIELVTPEGEPTRKVVDRAFIPSFTQRADPAAAFEGRGLKTVPSGSIPSLDGLPASDGRGWLGLGPLPDGSGDAWWMVGWNIVPDPTSGGPQYEAAWAGFQVVNRTGGGRATLLAKSTTGSCLIQGRTPEEIYGQPPRGLVALGGDTWACSGQSVIGSVEPFNSFNLGAWRGVRGGELVEWGTAGAVLTTDGRAAVRSNSQVAGQGTALCFTSFQRNVTECITRPELAQMEPMLSVGHAVAPAAGAAASVAWVSHRGAWPGQQVKVFGNRFGTSGRLTLGDVEVPSHHIVSWTDGEVAFTVPEDAPSVGRVRIDSGSGHDDGARGFFLWKTSRWTGPLESVPEQAMNLYQGLSALVGAEPGRSRTFEVADPGQAGVVAPMVTGGTHLLHPDGTCRAADALWISEGQWATNRPLVCHGKLDTQQPWTVVPFGQEWAQPERAPRPVQFYEELIATADVGPAPFYGKPSWLELVRSQGDRVTREAIFRPNGEEHAGTPSAGSLFTRPDGSVLRVGHRFAPKTLVRTEALDAVSGWQLRNNAPVGTAILAHGVAEFGGKTVVAGTDDADNLRGALRVSSDGTSFPTSIKGAASNPGSFAPIFAIPGGRRAGFVGVRWSGNIYAWAPGDGIRGLYTLSAGLQLVEDALPPPPGSSSVGRNDLDFGVWNARLFAWNRVSGALHVLDTDALDPQWTQVDVQGKRVTAFMVDGVRQRVLVAAQDTLWRSTQEGATLEPWPVPLQLPVNLGPMTVTSFALDASGRPHLGVAEWVGISSTPPVFGTLVGQPVP